MKVKADLPNAPAVQAKIVVISGGTGSTAKQLLSAALAQFAGCNVEIVYETKITTVKKATTIVKQAAADHSVICHSLVDPKIRKAVNDAATRLGVACIDALGPSLAILGDHLKLQPAGRAGLLYEVHREQMDRMAAIDFTLAHDDGQRLWGLSQADVVLVGASRTSKSVTCCYLAFRGLRAANVPLLPGHSVPAELTEISPTRVIGLTMNARHLESIRQTRADRITHIPLDNYTDRRALQRELADILSIFKKHKWRHIDISYKATEEVAEEIVEMLA